MKQLTIAHALVQPVTRVQITLSMFPRYIQKVTFSGSTLEYTHLTKPLKDRKVNIKQLWPSTRHGIHVQCAQQRSNNIRKAGTLFHMILTHFQEPFSILFQYLFNTNWKNFNTITYLHFSKILFMEDNAKKICKTVISGKEQNLNKQMAEFGISILFQYFMYILDKFNTFSRSWKPIAQFNTFSLPRRNPDSNIDGNQQLGQSFYSTWHTATKSGFRIDTAEPPAKFWWRPLYRASLTRARNIKQS